MILLACAVAWLPLQEVLLLVGGATCALLLLRWPWLIWLPLALLLPITSGLRLGRASVTDLLLAGAVALWFLDGARRRRLPLHGSPVVVAAGVYLAVLLVATLGAQEFEEAAAEVIKWAELWLLLLVAPAMLDTRQARWVAAALVAGGVFQAGYGLYQFVFQVGPEYFVILDRFMRASGSFGQPNPFGGYLGMTLPLATSLALWAWAGFLSRRGWRSSALLWAIFYTAATGIIAAGLLASWSRGAWLGAGVGVLVVLVLRSRTAALLTGLVLLLLLVTLLLGAFSPQMIPQPILARVEDVPAYLGLSDVLSQPVTDANFAVVERVAHWVAAQRMWEGAPWLGVGPGNYGAAYPAVHLPRWEEPLGHAHNVYLNVLAETGLVGLLAYCALMVTTVVWTWRRLREGSRAGTAAGRWQAALAVGVLGLLAQLAVHNVFDNLFVQGMVVYVGLWLALVHVDFNGVNS